MEKGAIIGLVVAILGIFGSLLKIGDSKELVTGTVVEKQITTEWTGGRCSNRVTAYYVTLDIEGFDRCRVDNKDLYSRAVVGQKIQTWMYPYQYNPAATSSKIFWSVIILLGFAVFILCRIGDSL